MPPCAAAECERLGGTSDRMIDVVAAPLGADRRARSPASPPPITSTSV